MSDDRLILALDVPNAIEGLALAEKLGDAVDFYKIGLGMLTGGGLALANELKAEHGKKIFLDMKLFDIGATVEKAVRGLAQFDLDFLTVHGDPHVVRAAQEGKGDKDMKILAVTILTSLDRADLDASCYKDGALGVSISIDDFGTGYSSLSYLKRFPVDILKVDRSFVKDIPDDSNDMEITAAIIAMAQKLKLNVVAEGVETVEQIEFLQNNNCYIVQGYYYSPPVSEADLPALFERLEQTDKI